jgi:hypothetical protein
MTDPSPEPQAPPRVEVVVLDADGRIVTDLFTEVRTPVNGEAGYGTAAQVAAADDLLEFNFFVVRWGFSVRLRALDLDQEDKIELESLVKHPKTQEWYQPPALKTAITLREGIIVPKLDKAQAEALRKRNPRIAEGIARWIRLLSSLTKETIEKYVADATSMDGAPPPVDDAGPGDPGLDTDPGYS